MNSKEIIIVSNYKWLFLTALLIQASFVFSFAVAPRPILVIQSLVVTCLFLFTIFSVQKMFLLLIVYISILPSFGWGTAYSIFSAYVSINVIFLMLFLISLYWMCKKSIIDIHTDASITSFGIFILLFSCLLVFSVLKGSLYSLPSRFILRELAYLSLYPLGYFIVFFNFKKEEWIRWFWIIIVAVSLISSFEYIWLAVFESGSYGFVRITTQQTHLAQLSIPFLMASFLFHPFQKRKIIPIIMLFPLFTMVLISLQRGLWIGVFVSLVVLFLLSLSKKGEVRKKAILVLIVMILFSFLALIVIKKLFSAQGIDILLMRALTFKNLSFDPSLWIRQVETGRALEQCKSTFFIGTGLGSTIKRAVTSGPPIWNIVDNSYVVLLWKTGVVGLLVYLAVVLMFLKNALYIFKRDQNVEHQIIAASSFAGFIGLMVIAFTNTCLVMYRFILIWASLFAIVEILKEKQLRIDSESLSF